MPMGRIDRLSRMRKQVDNRGVLDDLGADVALDHPPERVVSLVPSLTEAIALTVPGVLVGATNWCTHPAGLDVTRVRGTKNPDRAAIAALRPDLVVANQEENRRVDVERLRSAGIPVWVTRIDGIDDALGSMGRLFREGFGLREVGWLEEAREVWRHPPRLSGRVALPVWRDPWIWVGVGTYPNDLLCRLGLVNIVDDMRYPQLKISDMLSGGPDVVLLPDEPYPFTATDGPEALGGVGSLNVRGRSLFWYGPAMVGARADLEDAVHEGRGAFRKAPANW